MHNSCTGLTVSQAAGHAFFNEGPLVLTMASTLRQLVTAGCGTRSCGGATSQLFCAPPLLGLRATGNEQDCAVLRVTWLVCCAVLWHADIQPGAVLAPSHTRRQHVPAHRSRRHQRTPATLLHHAAAAAGCRPICAGGVQYQAVGISKADMSILVCLPHFCIMQPPQPTVELSVQAGLGYCLGPFV